MSAGALYLTRPEPAPTPTGTSTSTEPNFALTNEEAIARFEELDALRHQAFQEVDQSLLSTIYVPNSDVMEIAQGEIAQLRKDRVRDESRFTTRKFSILANDGEEIRIRQVVDVQPMFVAADGTDITDSPALIRRTVLWTLAEVDGRWLIGDSVITKARALRG